MPKVRFSAALVLAGIAAAACARGAHAGVVVSIEGNVAHAEISLDRGGRTYEADVTITFGAVQDLSVASLGLDAELVDPADPALAARLPAGMTVDPAFPMLIRVEPPADAGIFHDGFEGDGGGGTLTFLNTYEIEVHTHDLAYADDSPYRLAKSPVGGAFRDYTDDILAGSVRARGRDGAFSEFLILKDPNTTLIPLLLEATQKLLALQLRVVAAALDDVLNLDLLGLLADISADLVFLGLDLTGAIDALDRFIAEILAHAGVDIPNVWSADHSVTNDAGEILGLAQTLRFTLVRLLTAPLL